MFKLGDKVKVKLREPVGSPTTEEVNSYLKAVVDKECRILRQCENPQMFMVGVPDYIHGYVYAYDFELERVEDG